MRSWAHSAVQTRLWGSFKVMPFMEEVEMERSQLIRCRDMQNINPLDHPNSLIYEAHLQGSYCGPSYFVGAFSPLVVCSCYTPHTLQHS